MANPPFSMPAQPFPSFQLPPQPTRMELYSPSSSKGGSRAAKRLRASKPKVRSGCITCKTRRVKCDETKPGCLRCQKFGRVCDGYPENPPGNGSAISPTQPRSPSITIYNPDISPHSTEDESRYFQTFMDRSAQELSGFFDPSFWTRLVLQESHSVPPIRHAAIALGALNKSLESAPAPNLKVNVIQSIDKRHHEAAVQQYLKAIQALNHYISASDSPQLRTTLVACLLFVCFETFQGSLASSVQQTYGGLKILRSYYLGKPGSKPWIPPRSPAKASLKVATSGNISKVIQSRLGCGKISKTGALAMHLEEYLEQDALQRDPQGNLATVSEAYISDPILEQHNRPHSRAGAVFGEQKQRTIPDPRECPIYSTGIFDRQTIAMTAREDESMLRNSSVASFTAELSNSSTNTNSNITKAPRKASSTLPNVTISTLITHTPPSMGPPRTSSSSPTPPTSVSSSSQPSSNTQALINTRKRSIASRSSTPLPLNNDFAIEEILIQTFVRLDGQGLFFGMIPAIPPLIWDIHKTWHLPIPTSFSTFTEAHRCWDFLMDRALQFFRRTSFNRAFAPASLDPPDQIAAELKSYLDQLNAFAAAFQPILDSAVSEDATILNSAALVLSLYYKITIITLATIPSDSEMVYDNFLPDFKYIVQTATLLVESRNATQTPLNLRFSFEVGIVPPLHVTMTKCRDPLVRREAIKLLFSSPRQEGMWDSVLTARLGTWLTNCEEDGLEPPPILNSSKLPKFSKASLASNSGEVDGSNREFCYPSPPPMDEEGGIGGWDDGTSISDILNELLGESDEYLVSNTASSPKRGASSGTATKKVEKAKQVKKKQSAKNLKRWIVPEENRVRLMAVNFHISERYIKVKCQKALPGRDGKRQERETIVAW